MRRVPPECKIVLGVLGALASIATIITLVIMVVPVVCWNEWSGFGECSKSCGAGIQNRYRSLKTGFDSHTCHGDTQETRHCNIIACEVVCWNEWSGYGVCSTSCGAGIQNRYRSLKTGLDAHTCHGDTQETRHCNTIACEGSWSMWAPWLSCVGNCYSAIQSRERTCIKEDKLQTACIGQSSQKRPCDINCTAEWMGWTYWSACSSNHGSGIKSRHRECHVYPNSNCDGSYQQSQYCFECLNDQIICYVKGMRRTCCTGSCSWKRNDTRYTSCSMNYNPDSCGQSDNICYCNQDNCNHASVIILPVCQVAFIITTGYVLKAFNDGYVI